MKRRALPCLALALALAGPLVAGERLDDPFRAFVEVVAAVRDRHLDRGAAASPEPMRAAIRAYLEAFGDPATRYLAPDAWRNLDRSTKGSFQGFGFVVAMLDQGLVIERCYPGSPADRAGVQAGDEILATGDPPRPVHDLDALRALLASAPPKGLQLALGRQGRRLAIRVRPGPVELPSVEAHRLPRDLTYLRVHSFTERSPRELAAALHRIAGGRGAILDLRANAGGVLDAAVQMGGQLAGPGDVTWVVDGGRGREVRRTRREAALVSPPSVVLIDEGTASAAEVLAAYLRRKGAVLVGTRSYGKGTIQEVLPLADGGAAVLTVARYEVAPGVPLPDQGLTPDVVVAGPEAPAFPPRPGDDPPLARALDLVLRGR